MGVFCLNRGSVVRAGHFPPQETLRDSGPSLRGNWCPSQSKVIAYFPFCVSWPLFCSVIDVTALTWTAFTTVTFGHLTSVTFVDLVGVTFLSDICGLVTFADPGTVTFVDLAAVMFISNLYWSDNSNLCGYYSINLCQWPWLIWQHCPLSVTFIDLTAVTFVDLTTLTFASGPYWSHSIVLCHWPSWIL